MLKISKTFLIKLQTSNIPYLITTKLNCIKSIKKLSSILTNFLISLYYSLYHHITPQLFSLIESLQFTHIQHHNQAIIHEQLDTIFYIILVYNPSFLTDIELLQNHLGIISETFGHSKILISKNKIYLNHQ